MACMGKKKEIGEYSNKKDRTKSLYLRLYEDINLLLKTCHWKTSSDNRGKEIMSS